MWCIYLVWWIVDKQIDPVELLTGDRNALMVAIRITGYGAEYETEVECGGCNVKSKQVFNLAELPIKSLELEPVEPGSNLFEFVLPYCKKSVKFKFMNGLDEEEIVVSSERQKKLGMQASTSSSPISSITFSTGLRGSTGRLL
jgi:hypothetical protein